MSCATFGSNSILSSFPNWRALIHTHITSTYQLNYCAYTSTIWMAFKMIILMNRLTSCVYITSQHCRYTWHGSPFKLREKKSLSISNESHLHHMLLLFFALEASKCYRIINSSSIWNGAETPKRTCFLAHRKFYVMLDAHEISFNWISISNYPLLCVVIVLQSSTIIALWSL